MKYTLNYNQELFDDIIEKINEAIFDLKEDTEHIYISEFHDEPTKSEIVETINAYGIKEWDGEEVPCEWVDDIWASNNWSDETFSLLIKTEQYTMLKNKCQSLKEQTKKFIIVNNAISLADERDRTETERQTNNWILRGGW
jgi:hypothetical protein